MRDNAKILIGEITREYTVIDSEIKFIEVTTEHSLTTDIKELADDIGYGKIIMNHEKITVIKKIKL